MMLNKMLDQGEWIVEGVYYAWCKRCFEEADRIILLDVPPQVYKYRILKRYIRRKLKLEKGKKETWKSVRDLIRWADKYHKYDLVKIKKLLDDHAEKVTILYNTKKRFYIIWCWWPVPSTPFWIYKRHSIQYTLSD